MGVSKMELFVCGGREIAIFCMWGSRKCNFWYVGVSKSPCYVRISKTPCPWYMRVSKKYNSLPFPIFNLNSPYPVIHHLENTSILRVFVLFTFIMILVHFIWVFGPFLCILNFFASFYFRCFSCHISVGSFYVFQHTRLTTRVWTYATNTYWHNYKWLVTP